MSNIKSDSQYMRYWVLQYARFSIKLLMYITKLFAEIYISKLAIDGQTAGPNLLKLCQIQNFEVFSKGFHKFHGQRRALRLVFNNFRGIMINLDSDKGL